MRKSRKLLFVVFLIGAALAVPAPRASATNWCQICNDSGDCIACCKCIGHSVVLCESGCLR
jgi:hypothetical protein